MKAAVEFGVLEEFLDDEDEVAPDEDPRDEAHESIHVIAVVGPVISVSLVHYDCHHEGREDDEPMILVLIEESILVEHYNLDY